MYRQASSGMTVAECSLQKVDEDSSRSCQTLGSLTLPSVKHAVVVVVAC